MTDRLIRIKSSRQGYRRGGLDLGSDWLEVETSDLSDAQARAILADPVLTIEGHEGEGRWSPLAGEIREGLVLLLDGKLQDEAQADAELAGDGTGEPLAEIDPEQLRRAELGADLESAIADNEELLTSVQLWPVKDPARLFIVVVDSLVEATGEIDRRGKALDAVTTERDALQADVEALKAELAQLKNNPASEEPDGGGGDAAAPAAAEPAADANAPATAGGGTAEAAPKPKPTGGGKAKSKAD